MKRSPLILTAGALLIALVVLLLVTFQVRESQVAIVTTFGKVTRDNLGPGVHFKLPAPIQKHYIFDQRVRNFEDQFTQDYTSDNNNLLTMVYVGWRITDPKEFFPKFEGGSAAKAESQLNSIVRNAKSAVVGRHPLADFVNADENQLKFDQIESEMKTLVESQLATNHWGMTIEFLGIKKLGLPDSVVVAVFDQMRSKRDLLASEFQNQGEAAAQRIRSQADREAGEMLVNANAEATRIRGRAEAAAAASLAAFQQNPDLAIYLLSLNSLEQALREKATLVFDQKMPPFDLFQGFATNRLSR